MIKVQHKGVDYKMTSNNNKVIIKNEDRKKATPVSDFKDYILKALDFLGGARTRDKIHQHVTEEHPFNDYDNMYNQLKSTGAPVHKVGNNHFAHALRCLQQEKKIKKEGGKYIKL